MSSQETLVKSRVPHLLIINDEIKKVSRMSTTDIFNHPRFIANNSLGQLKNAAQGEFNKRHLFGETLRLLGWFAHRTNTIRQNSMYHFSRKMNGENKDLLMDYLHKDYDSSREGMLNEIMDASYFTFPGELCPDWVYKGRKSAYRETGKDGIFWGESIRLVTDFQTTELLDRHNLDREKAPKSPHYTYGRDFSDYPNPMAWEELFYHDSRLPLVSLYNTFHSTDNKEYSETGNPGIQILVRPNNTRKHAYVLISYANGQVKKEYIDHDSFFDGNNEKINETLKRIGVVDEKDVKDVNPEKLIQVFKEYANQGKPLDRDFYSKVFDKKANEYRPQLNKKNKIDRKKWERIFSPKLPKSLPFLDTTNINIAFYEILHKRLDGIERPGNLYQPKDVIDLAKEYVNGYFEYYIHEMHLLDAGNNITYGNVIQTINEYRIAADSLKKYLEAVILEVKFSHTEELIRYVVNYADDSLKVNIETLRKEFIRLPDAFKNVLWLEEIHPIVRIGGEYSFLAGKVEKTDYRKPIINDHFRYSSKVTRIGLTEKETNPPERLAESLELIGKEGLKMYLYSFKNPSGLTRRRIFVFSVSNKKNETKSGFIFNEDGHGERWTVSTGGDVEKERQKLVSDGIPDEMFIPKTVDFDKTWQRFIDYANSYNPPSNVLDLLVYGPNSDPTLA